ncbi:MAG: tautomerase family protein [Firmicutes bacterium]|uniref:Tautomerase family protein n=1 Tax=Candidatus Stercoripulliclostridium pullicola TaxID=2840953 RepID=A0A940DFR9_9FIRM|nr:tautomerase family protein [Candidatus Stercoripulliclostridium pullicola]
MPHIAVTMYPGRDEEIKSRFAEKLTAFVAEELGVSPSVVSVSVEDIDKKDWEKHLASFDEEIMYVKEGRSIKS